MSKDDRNIWGPKMLRMVEMIRLLSRQTGASVEELAEELELSKRTIYRMIETLELLVGEPLAEIKGLLVREKRLAFPEGFTLSLPLSETVGLTIPELMALYALRMNAGLFRGGIIAEDIDTAFAKIGSALSPETKATLERYARLFVSVPKTPKDYSLHSETIEELAMAILSRKTCTVSYTSFSDDQMQEKQYDINPLHFFERDGGLYVFVVVTKYDDIRLLAVERILRVEMSESGFMWPEDFEPEKLLGNALGLYWDDAVSAKIWFHHSQARYIRERQWATGQKLLENSDGSIVLSIHTSSRYDVKRWVLSFGNSAELLEPPELRNEIAQEIAELANRYA